MGSVVLEAGSQTTEHRRAESLQRLIVAREPSIQLLTIKQSDRSSFFHDLVLSLLVRLEEGLQGRPT